MIVEQSKKKNSSPHRSTIQHLIHDKERTRLNFGSGDENEYIYDHYQAKFIISHRAKLPKMEIQSDNTEHCRPCGDSYHKQ